MPEREIKLGLMTYRNADGNTTWDVQGTTVDVHPDDIERFDALNIDMGPPHDPQRESMDMLSGGGAEKPQQQRRSRKSSS